jgi:hypothetical protein
MSEEKNIKNRQWVENNLSPTFLNKTYHWIDEHGILFFLMFVITGLVCVVTWVSLRYQNGYTIYNQIRLVYWRAVLFGVPYPKEVVAGVYFEEWGGLLSLYENTKTYYWFCWLLHYFHIIKKYPIEMVETKEGEMVFEIKQWFYSGAGEKDTFYNVSNYLVLYKRFQEEIKILYKLDISKYDYDISYDIKLLGLNLDNKEDMIISTQKVSLTNINEKVFVESLRETTNNAIQNAGNHLRVDGVTPSVSNYRIIGVLSVIIYYQRDRFVRKSVLDLLLSLFPKNRKSLTKKLS